MITQSEANFDVPASPADRTIRHLRKAIGLKRDCDQIVRFAVTSSLAGRYQCEIATASDVDVRTIFEFFRLARRPESEQFNVVLLVPTGIGAEIGGHAGDAGPVARLLAEQCDALITHPNVVNASDINELPEAAMYVEGSVLCRLLMGTIGLQRVRSNRLLVVVGKHNDQVFVDAAINSVNAARATYGLRASVAILDPPLKMIGGPTPTIENFRELCIMLDGYPASDYDAIAICSVIDIPQHLHRDYYEAKGGIVNPWGNVEAMLTHALSARYNLPTAHAPMCNSEEIAKLDLGVVDPRMAAETVSVAYMQCILKGLHRSPRIIVDQHERAGHGVLSAKDIACLVIPDGCLGLPTFAACEQGITVIAVKENRNAMRNDLSILPWRPDQLYVVDNYWEAAGVLASLRAGLDPESVRRPLKPANVSSMEWRSE